MPRTIRRLTVLCAAVLLPLALAAPVVAEPSVGPTGEDADSQVQTQQQDPPHRSYAYRVTSRGDVHTDVDVFAAAVDDILRDARGWSLGGSVAFGEVGSGEDFEVSIASPQTIDDAHEVCSPDYSCRVGDQVLINDRNWRNATSAWRDSGAPLWLYRYYLIYHEVGHWLGFGHWDCPTPGADAPVMQQQSIDLEGCEANGFPLASERESLGERLGVPVYDDWIYPDVVRGHTHRDSIHAVTDAGVAAGYPDGYFRPERAARRDQMATFIARALDLTASGSSSFEDVSEDNPHSDAIAALEEEGIVSGRDGRFHPHREITRAQMASMIALAYDLTNEEEPRFHDVDPDGVHADNIAAVDEAGIAEGYDDGTYRPNRSLTRAQMATFLVHADDGI